MGLGKILSQNFDSEEHPIIFASCKLTLVEWCYAAIKHEALAIKWELEDLCYYLMGCHFVLIMDHTSLQWMSQRHQQMVN